MKRIIATTIAIAVLLTSALISAACFVGASARDIRIKETVVFGDRAAADGIEIESRAYYKHHLFWETRYTVGATPVCETTYDFTAVQDFKYWGSSQKIWRGIEMGTSIPNGCSFDVPAEEQEGIARAYKELYDTVSIGEEKERTVKLSDYYDYYPLSVDIDLPDTEWRRYGSNLKDQEGSTAYVLERFRSYFKIPVSKSSAMTISVGRGREGSISIGSTTSTYGEGDMYYMETVSAYGDGVCYFSIANRTVSGELVDTGFIEDGYGIYSFDFGRNYGEYPSGIDADSLKLAFALSPEETVTDISLSSDGKSLMVYTFDDRKTVLRVLDTETMSEKQSITVEDGRYSYIWEYDDYVVMRFFSSQKLAVLEREDDRTWKKAFSVTDASELYGVSHQYGAAFDYKDGRLAVVNNIYNAKYGPQQPCSFYLSVYDKSGLLYIGEYENSLDLSQAGGRNELNCLPATNAYGVRWGD